VRVLIADDSLLVRQGTASLLEDEGFDVVGQAGTAEDALLLARALRPDVVILDIRMPPTHTTEGLEAAARIREEHGDAIGVLVLSQHVEPGYAMGLIESGARGVGYLLKDRLADADELADAVKRVARGGSVIDPEVVAMLVASRTRDALGGLTEREREVLGLMAEGRSNQAIVERLVVSPKTVETHISSIFSKLGLEVAPDDHRRVLAVLTWLRR
jgi:DNA-binding NarL/FixJ family response regulator